MHINSLELDRRISTLEEAYSNCDICPEKCHVDRNSDKLGTCGLGSEGRVYKEFLHFGEEPEISPTHAIYLAGCNFRCRYCSDLKEVTQPRKIPSTDELWLAKQIMTRTQQGARSISFVGGSPDVQPLFVLRVLREANNKLPVVWNSNLWMAPETLELLLGVVDIFIADLKYGPGKCDEKLSSAANTMLRISDLMKTIVDSEARLIIRHLILPGHLECCTIPVIEKSAELGPDVYLNLMTGYRPFHLRGRSDQLGNRLSRQEAERAINLAQKRFGSQINLRRDGQRL
tara:strand:- start:56 stop:916 length:861 start_codon:yes stop_codon:yes gene_type:complete